MDGSAGEERSNCIADTGKACRW